MSERAGNRHHSHTSCRNVWVLQHSTLGPWHPSPSKARTHMEAVSRHQGWERWAGLDLAWWCPGNLGSVGFGEAEESAPDFTHLQSLCLLVPVAILPERDPQQADKEIQRETQHQRQAASRREREESRRPVHQGWRCGKLYAGSTAVGESL